MRGVGSLLTAAVTAATPAIAQAIAPAAIPARVPATPFVLDAAARPLLVTRPLSTVAPDARAAVTGVSVVAGSEAAATVVVRVDRAVAVQDFVLDGPRRVVLDISGATLALTESARYDGTARGGVVNVRLSQFRAGVVRVVVELDGRRKYRVERVDGAVRLVVEGAATGFATWQTGAAPTMTAAAEHAPTIAADAQQPSQQPSQPPVRTAAQRREAAPAQHAEPKAEPRRELARDVAVRDVPVREVARVAEAEREPVRRVAPSAPRLTVTYQEADVRDVIAAFATFSGRTIIVGRDVKGSVTAEVKDQPWQVAFRSILNANGLAASEDGNGIITVDSYANILGKQQSEPVTTQMVSLNYAKAASLVQTVQTLLTRDCGGTASIGEPGATPGATPQGGQGCQVRGSVSADSATNSLIVREVVSRADELVRFIRQLDVRTPQVAIKAKIVFVNRTGLEDIGVSYDLGTGTQQFFQKLVQRIDPSTRQGMDTNGDGVPDAMGGGTAFPGDRVALGGNALSALANANQALNPSALNLIYSATLGRFQLTSFVNALQQTELAEVQSEPSIVTVNNRPAEIFVGQQIPIRVIDASAGGNGGGNSGGAPRATVRLEEAGIKLSVTPQVTNNRQVLLDLKAENSNAQISTLDVGVVFNRQRAENRLLVGDGETAAIGGLTVTETLKVKTGIPFLVDLPFIGRLFGQVRTNEIKRDLLILVTPHILDEGEPAPIAPPRR